MKKSTILILLSFIALFVTAQIDPVNSPYYQSGTYTVESDSTEGMSPADVLIFRPDNADNGPYPTILFQLGANSIGTSIINRHSYDLYWEHVASYGFTVIIIDNSEGGPNATIFTDIHDWIKSNVETTGHWMESYVDLNKFYVSGHSNGGMNATDIIIDRPTEINGIAYMASYPNPGMLGFSAQNVTAYTGNVLLMCGDEDDTSAPLVGSTNDVARTAYDEKFGSEESKTWVLLTGVGHGGFGDYDNPEQPVGTAGREPVTASVRHYLLSWLLSQAYNNQTAYDNLTNTANQPNTTGEFETTTSTPTFVSALDNKTNVSLYPNPASECLTLSANKISKIEVFDMLGNKIYENLPNSKTFKINVKTWKKGMYMIRINNQITKQFIIN